MTPDSPTWDDVSRELTLTCDADGQILRADARALRLLGTDVVGRRLSALAVPGTEAKVEAFVARARETALTSVELSLLATGRPATVTASARPGPDRTLHIHGLVLPDDYGATVRYLTDTVGDAVELNRVIGRQKKELLLKNAALEKAYRELDESSQGIVTLHAELADKAAALQRTADVKSRVMANVSHEFRTPLHTILGLSKLLAAGSDGPLTEEQQKQVRFIRTSAEELSALVNDFLDISKAESGTAILRPTTFTATDLIASLRGQMRPLVPAGEAVSLVFEEPPADLQLETDQGKVHQIVRNLVSNALKFTEQGEIRVTLAAQDDQVVVQVRDTGIGIAREHFDRIFEEFGQIDSPTQAKVRGTGLGLALSRKLAELLGGSLAVESVVGRGSTFTLVVPRAHPEVRELRAIEAQPLDPSKAPVLVVEDDRKTIFIYEKYLSMAGFQVLPARNIDHARALLATVRPAAIVLDIMLEGESSWGFLGELKRDPETKDIPVLVVTITNKEHKARALGADEFWLKPVDQDTLLRKLRSISRPTSAARVLVIDDDDRARYLLRKLLDKTPFEMLEASTGPTGIECARERRPDVILLDFLLQDMTAFDVLDDLKADPRTRSIPVVIVTSHLLDAAERQRLAADTEAILSKESLSRELAINRIRDALEKAGVGNRAAPEV